MATVPEVLYIEMAVNSDEENVKFPQAHENVVDALMAQFTDRQKFKTSSWEVWEYRRVCKVNAGISLTPMKETEE